MRFSPIFLILSLWLPIKFSLLAQPASLPAPAPEPGATNNIQYQIPEATILEFLVPLSPAAQLSLANNNLSHLQAAAAGIAVPQKFNPTNKYPLLIVNATSDGDASSIRAMRSFTNIALSMGFVVAAADGPLGRPTNDTPIFRFAMLNSVLEHMHKSWPASKSWPIVCAGFSGGGKWSGVIGAGLNGQGYKVIGVFQGGVNQDFTSEAARLYPPTTGYRATPFYLSSGITDKLATPDQHDEVRRSLLMNGFNLVRVENHEGGHNLDQDHLRKAFTWFLENHKRQPALVPATKPPPRPRFTNKVTSVRPTNVEPAIPASINLPPAKTELQP